jgi:hypothetical protein
VCYNILDLLLYFCYNIIDSIYYSAIYSTDLNRTIKNQRLKSITIVLLSVFVKGSTEYPKHAPRTAHTTKISCSIQQHLTELVLPSSALDGSHCTSKQPQPISCLTCCEQPRSLLWSCCRAKPILRSTTNSPSLMTGFFMFHENYSGMRRESRLMILLVDHV